MDSKTLPIIFQHVREIAEVNLGGSLNVRYKIITPFPAVGNDFFDFNRSDLDFSDSQIDANAATSDTIKAFDFFTNTDNLYYNFSYGIKSQDYFLSHICKKFYREATLNEAVNVDFKENYDEKNDAFFRKFKRSTIGDLGNFDFYYSSLSPIQWSSTKIELVKNDINRLKEKLLTLYSDIKDINSEFIKVLVSETEALSYTKIDYELGFFDVIREWMDPQLFENSNWHFKDESDALYGENDTDFTSNDVRLCYAKRFYIIKNFSGVSSLPLVTQNPVVHDHTLKGTISNVPQSLSQIKVHDHRTAVRNTLLKGKLGQSHSLTPIDPKGGYVWVPDSGSIPGHWEGKRATPKVDEPALIDPIYKIAAVIGRVIPWKPVTNVSPEVL